MVLKHTGEFGDAEIIAQHRTPFSAQAFAALAFLEEWKLTHPPLREALIDIRLREELPASVLPKFEAPKGFPVKKGIKHGQFQLQAEADKPFEAKVLTEEALGIRYAREDGGR